MSATPAREPLEGYAECHFCTVTPKRRSWRCIRCVGRLGLKERVVRAAEDRSRRTAATVLSLLVPGSGHWYRSNPGPGFLFFILFGAAAAYLYFIKVEMNFGRWFLAGIMMILYAAAAIDVRRGGRDPRPPCQEACPAHLACALYVTHIKEERCAESLETVQSRCPFPGAIGRICHHPCEQSCRRAERGEAIAICALKRFAADQAAGRENDFYRREVSRPGREFTERIAVVGGGPAGLSAALHLRLLGFPATLFEAENETGGMPGAAIPDYRLPAHIYREEVERVLAAGFEVRTGRRLGGDFTLADLKAEGFSAAFLAIGASRSIALPHCGTEEEGFLDGLRFLKDSKAGTAPALEGHVLVIGGGNVAVDVAKTAVRLGAASVRKIFLETRETMPAHAWECEEAIEEGVVLVPAAATISFDRVDGRVAAARCLRVERIDFEEGRIKPVMKEGTDFTLEADWVITAVGTAPDHGVLGTRLSRKPLRPGMSIIRLPADLASGMPVFAGGDFFTGPSSAIGAIASGSEAALEIYRTLGKTRLLRGPAWNRMRRRRAPGYLDAPEKNRRKHPGKVEADVRCESFCEICEVYDEETAREEAGRCLRCRWPMEPVTVKRGPAPPAVYAPPGSAADAKR